MNHTKLHWKSKTYKRWRIAIIIFLLCVLTSRYFIWGLVVSSTSQAATTNFNQITDNDVGALQNRLERYTDALYAGQALFLVDKSVSGQDWSDFMNIQGIAQRYPGTDSVVYASFTHSSTVAPSALVTYATPSPAALPSVGYDLLSDPKLTKELQAARDSGTAQVNTIDELSGSQLSQPKLFIVLPVYIDPSAELRQASQRQAALKGYVALILSAQPTLDAIFKTQLNEAVSVSIVADGQTIYSKPSNIRRPLITRTVSMDTGGEKWQVNFAASNKFGLTTTSVLAPQFVIGSAVPLALLLSLVAYYAIRLGEVRLRRHSDATKTDHN